MTLKRIIFSLLVSISIFSCIEVNTIMPKASPKFAIVAIASPTDSLVTAFISAINPLGEAFKATDMIVKNAKVSLTSGNEQLLLGYVDSTQRYQATTKTFIKYDTKYDLMVEIPNQPPIKGSYKTLKEIFPTILLSKKEKTVEIEVSWKDTPNEDNNYSLSINYWNAQLRRASSAGIDWEGIARSTFSVSDKDNLNPFFSSKATLLNSSSISDTTKFTLIFYNIDQSTSDFFSKRSAQYNQNRANQQSILDFITDVSQSQTDLNTFFERFKEPVLLPTNIKGGLGFFGGYYQKRIKI